MTTRNSCRLPPMSGVVLWEKGAVADQYTVAQILTGDAADFVPVEDDFMLLESLLRYNYLSGQQANRLAGHDVHKRLSALFNLGLADRTWGTYRTTQVMVILKNMESANRTKHIKERVFALSQKGLDLLVEIGSELAVAWAGDWQPKSRSGSRKNSLAHELGRNDFCLAVIRAANNLGQPVIDWRGPREAFHRYSPGTGAAALLSEPDSVLVLANGQPVLVEYERSGRVDRFYKKMMATHNYLASGGWKQRFGDVRPWVVYAIPEGTGTQMRASGSYGGLLKQAVVGNAMRYALVDQAAWEMGTWDAVTSDGTVTSLWHLLLGTGR